ncbi:hypothetical protein E3N88_25114 [Mikania micrantha]|uniref:Tf2-1-like SH3-like domain-containing protein n=1 Tax=Mikania micrantha TaxID=192012 RepID=A0A5N6N5A1_9ASTR|nr:hypothetical protein E3N88_25114 [Mikania micrantha]
MMNVGENRVQNGVLDCPESKNEEKSLRPFKILEQIGPVAYRLELPLELSNIHDVFHVSNLKKCLTDESLIVPLEEIHIDEKLQFSEEPVEVMDREMKVLKRSRIPIVKVRWNSQRGPEYTWEREDQMKSNPGLSGIEKRRKITKCWSIGLIAVRGGGLEGSPRYAMLGKYLRFLRISSRYAKPFWASGRGENTHINHHPNSIFKPSERKDRTRDHHNKF